MKRAGKRKPAKINLGIIGTGWPGQQHARVTSAHPEALGSTHAQISIRKDARVEFQQTYAPRRSFRDYHELLQDPEVHAVVICLPNFLHFPASRAALEAGKHVFCEKPPTLNAAEMKVLHEEAPEARPGLFFRPTISIHARDARGEEARRGGTAGANLSRASDMGAVARNPARGSVAGLQQRNVLGGGALIDIGVHALDSVVVFNGNADAVSVSAQVYRNFEHLVRAPSSTSKTRRLASSVLTMGRSSTWKLAGPAICPDDIPEGQEFGREINNSIIYGTRGTIRLKPLTLFEDQAGALVTVPVELPDEIEGFELQLRNFLDAISGRAEAINNADQAVTLMEMLDAIYASSASAGK